MAKKSIFSDIENKFYEDFDRFVKFTVQELSTDFNAGGVSPVYTGYFASSWTAAQSGYVRKEDPQESQKNRSTKQPWRDAWESRGALPGRIDERFLDSVMKRQFDFRKTVRIGNRTSYAAFAMQKGQVAFFVQGDLRKLVDRYFGDRRDMADLRVGDRPVVTRPYDQYGIGRRPGTVRSTPIMRGRQES